MAAKLLAAIHEVLCVFADSWIDTHRDRGQIMRARWMEMHGDTF